MTKSYVVAAGEYSDHHTIGVFSTEKIAQEFCDRYNDGHPIYRAYIERHTIDEYAIQPQQKYPYFVRLGEEWSASEIFYVVKDIKLHEKLQLKRIIGDFGALKGKLELSGIIYAANAAEAVKIVEAKRKELLDSGNWKLEDDENDET